MNQRLRVLVTLAKRYMLFELVGYTALLLSLCVLILLLYMIR